MNSFGEKFATSNRPRPSRDTWDGRTIAAVRALPQTYDMRKRIGIAIAVLGLGLLAAGAWVAHRSHQRAQKIAVLDGSIKVTAGGMLNTTVDVYDGNDIARAAFDYDLVENHRVALQQLGFSSVHVQTAAGQALDKPL